MGAFLNKMNRIFFFIITDGTVKPTPAPSTYAYINYKNKEIKETFWNKVNCVKPKAGWSGPSKEELLIDWKTDVEWAEDRVSKFAKRFALLAIYYVCCLQNFDKNTRNGFVRIIFSGFLYLSIFLFHLSTAKSGGKDHCP